SALLLRRLSTFLSCSLHISSSLFCPVPPRSLHSFPTRRSSDLGARAGDALDGRSVRRLFAHRLWHNFQRSSGERRCPRPKFFFRSEEHTSELQSRFDLVCRLLLEKKKEKKQRGSVV